MILANILFRSYLNQGEKIYFVAHTHPFMNYGSFFKTLLLGIVLPLGFNIIMPPFSMIWMTWVVIGGLLFVYELLDWYMDAWIITNLGVIDLQWDGFFHKSSTRIEYHTIEGITYEIRGFWGTIMNYGDIMIERLGTGTVVTLKDVAFPKSIERKVLKYQAKFVSAKNFKDETALKDLLVQMVQGQRRGK